MKSKPQVSLECMVWNKESHGLFDYESKECKEYKFTLKDDTKVYRQGSKDLKYFRWYSCGVRCSLKEDASWLRTHGWVPL